MTATSNIHINLPGWSNATYAVGARRNNSGNAYQCIIAGTSTAPPTGTASDIAPGGTAHWKWLSAIDYTTLQDWANGIPSTLTQPVVGLIWNDATPTMTATAGTAVLSLTGHTTSSTNTITLQAAPGDGFADHYVAFPATAFYYNNANGVSIELPATGFGGINYVQIDDSYVTIQGLQFKDLNGSSGASIVGGIGTHVSLRKNIFEGTTQAGGASIIGIVGNNLSLTNNMIVDHDSGATGGTVGAQGATGVVIANNTCVQYAFTTGKGFADAGSNTTLGSNSGINNIFVNFDRVWFSSTGQPWATKYNAYTNASFDGTNATDTGGSIYGISGGSTFINFANDFHLLSGASCINAGFADTADIPTADDVVGTSRPQGPAWDIGAHELLVGHTISRDHTMAVTVLASPARTISAPAEIISSTFSDTPSGFYVGANKSVDQPISASFVAPISADRIAPIEWSGAVQSPPTRDFAIPLEWFTTMRVDTPVALNLRATLAVDAYVPIYSMALPFPAVSPFTPDFSADFGAGPVNASATGIEWGTSVFGPIIPTPLETNLAVVTGVVSPIEPRGYAGLVIDHPIGLSWSTALASDRIAPIETNLQAGASIASPAEWTGSVNVDVPLSVSPMASVAVQPTGFIEWVLAVSVDTAVTCTTLELLQTTFINPLETSTLVQVDDPQPIAMLTGISLSITPPTEYLQSAATSAAIPTEFGGVSVSTSQVIGLDWRSVVLADVSPPADTSASMVVSTPAAVEFGIGVFADVQSAPLTLSTRFADAISPAEWGHLLITRAVDAAMPLEILASVKTDVVAQFDMNIERHAIGSSLEPDEWEEDHEP